MDHIVPSLIARLQVSEQDQMIGYVFWLLNVAIHHSACGWKADLMCCRHHLP